MSEKIFKILLEEFKRNGVKLIGHDFRCDVFISDPADIIHETFERQCTTIPQLLDFSEHDKVFEDKIAELEKEIVNYKQAFEDKCADYGFVSELLGKYQQENESLKQRVDELEKELEEWKEEARVVKKQRDEQLKSFRKGIEPYVDLLHMHETISELKQRIAELESKETETCEKEPKISDSAPSIDWYENRHQADCIEINRLNTTIDVLIHKVEYLRQFAGLE